MLASVAKCKLYQLCNKDEIVHNIFYLGGTTDDNLPLTHTLLTLDLMQD